MKRIKMIIEYDGSNYHGFQIQKNAHTVQAELEERIYELTGEGISISAAGRTDSGVHALGQVIAFDTVSTIPPAKWKFALNSLLPADIKVLKSCEVKKKFHPRFNAQKKRYSYFIYRSGSGQTFLKKYSFCTTEELDIGAMRKGCKIIEGRKNFQSFCASGSSAKSYDRFVSMCSLKEQGPFLVIDIEADGFLYHMVRIIVGTLLEVGRKNYSSMHIQEIIDACDRALAGPTALPNGLFLVKVFYPEDI